MLLIEVHNAILQSVLQQAALYHFTNHPQTGQVHILKRRFYVKQAFNKFPILLALFY